MRLFINKSLNFRFEFLKFSLFVFLIIFFNDISILFIDSIILLYECFNNINSSSFSCGEKLNSSDDISPPYIILPPDLLIFLDNSSDAFSIFSFKLSAAFSICFLAASLISSKCLAAFSLIVFCNLVACFLIASVKLLKLTPPRCSYPNLSIIFLP